MDTSPVWYPTQEQIEATRLYQWMNKLGFDDYESFRLRSVEDIAWFWNEAVKELEIDWATPYTSPLDLTNEKPFPNWFVDGKMNVVTNAVDKWAANNEMKDKTALIWESDGGTNQTVKLTFKELHDEVCQIAGGFKQLGIKPGDVVSLYMPMIPETVIAMLAIAKIGAIFCPAFSGYGAEAVAVRINAAKAQYLLTASSFQRRGKTINMLAVAKQAVEMCPLIEKVIIVGECNDQNENYVDWESLRFASAEQHTYDSLANEPFMLLYTSGTTGKPKGTVHTHAGFPIKAAFDAGLCMDVKKNDTLFWYTDMGWMMGPFLVFGGLINGAAIVLYEGTPDYPSPDRLWQIAEKNRVTHLGISPTLVRSLLKFGDTWVPDHEFAHLRVFGSTGEPWNVKPWLWLYEQVGKSKLPIFNYSGGTEISGGILGNVLIKPISAITFNSALPGMDAKVFSKDGDTITNQVGELVIRQPWVGMTNGFWHEPERYLEAYWNTYPDTWIHGDFAVCDDEGYWTISGRSDDSLNIAGKRLGPAEMESVLTKHEKVIEAAVIGVPDPDKGEAAVCFVVLQAGVTEFDVVKTELIRLIELTLGKALRPKEIHFTADIPKTRNSKVMRRVIKSAYLNKDAGDLSALENPDVVEEIRLIGQRVMKI